jgi:hypothetical protein
MLVQTKVKGNTKSKVYNLILALLIIFIIPLQAEKVILLPEVLKPTGLAIGQQYIYIIEKSTIYIYSRESNKFINKFGQAGEGPEEFKNAPMIIPQSDHLIINSTGKVSYFSTEGAFIKELKTPSSQSLFYPIKSFFVGKARVFENDIAYFTVNLYDSQLQKGKEIYRVKDFQQLKKATITFPVREPKYATLGDRIIIAGKPGFVIDILDETGKRLHSIKDENFKRRKFTQEDEKAFRELLKNTYKERYEMYKQYLRFHDYYPEISFIFTDVDNIYVTTWRISNDRVELFEYDSEGKHLSTYYVKIIWQSVLRPYPIRIKDRKIFQLVENQDENWELHISKLSPFIASAVILY